jgi:hypothetical protein
MRSKDLVATLKQQGCGGSTVAAQLKKLTDEGTIRKIKYPETLKYGLRKKDVKARYYILAKDSEQAQYYDTIIAALNSNDAKERKNALREIESIKDVQLLPEQLTKLASALSKEDATGAHQILRIISEHFDKYIYPDKLEIFQKQLIECFNKHYLIHDANSNLRQYILQMLGILHNKKVIDFLKRDLKEHTHDDLINYSYQAWQLAPIIHEDRIELFKFAHTLPEEKSRILYTIRMLAKEHLQDNRSNIQEHKKHLKEKKP